MQKTEYSVFGSNRHFRPTKFRQNLPNVRFLPEFRHFRPNFRQNIQLNQRFSAKYTYFGRNCGIFGFCRKLRCFFGFGQNWKSSFGRTLIDSKGQCSMQTLQTLQTSLEDKTNLTFEVNLQSWPILMASPGYGWSWIVMVTLVALLKLTIFCRHSLWQWLF